MWKSSNGRSTGAPMADLLKGRRAVNAPGSAPSVRNPFLPEGELWRIGRFPMLLVRTAERAKECLDSGDPERALVYCYWFFQWACEVDRCLVQTEWDMSKPCLGFQVEMMTLGLRWGEIKRRSGLENVDLTRTDDFEVVEFDWPGHEAVYRAFFDDALRLLEVIGEPEEDPGPIPFAPKPEADGRATDASADRLELVTAPPSGVGTAAANDQDIDADGWKFLLALDELRAWSEEDAKLRNVILKHAEIGGHPRGNKLQVMIARLKTMELIETLTGSKGGSWLTAKGRALVAIHRISRTTNAINK